ncbi:unnamed protein product [Adineta ricciae]|uniref:AIG1-type G domain-containing protein n=1 Tax=Adineta ricciae TaxID=249248 RepID=A0A815HN31_ADIRI|nr:unnamed protein product [Adineta ricciae]
MSKKIVGIKKSLAHTLRQSQSTLLSKLRSASTGNSALSNNLHSASASYLHSVPSNSSHSVSARNSYPVSASHVEPIRETLDTSSMAKILVIGETGSGKSTFINYLTNYFRNGTLQNLRVAIPSRYHPQPTENFGYNENDVNNTSQSKTDSCNQYMFVHNGKQYLFLDTPGLADTRGAQQDDKNILCIIDAVEHLGGLTAVVIVVNGAVCRLTVNLRNVIARLRGNLPDVVMDNVILVLTNATRHAANFNITSFNLNGNVYPYYMQNSAFSQDPATWSTAALTSLQYEWDQSMNELAALLGTIDSFKTKSVSAFKTMKDIRYSNDAG